MCIYMLVKIDNMRLDAKRNLINHFVIQNGHMGLQLSTGSPYYDARN